MRVCDGQDLGALIILILSMTIYGITLLHDPQSLYEFSLPWGNQGPDMLTVEVNGSMNADGIYFFPEKIDVSNMLRITGIEGKIAAANFAISNEEAICIYSAAGAVTISDMPAVRRLALGLSLDLNRAAAEDLILVPGIGKRLALEIIQRRETLGKFNVFSDLATVPGIKERKLNGLKKYLRIVLTH